MIPVATQVFDGLMLSDGSLEKSNRSKNARLCLRCKHRGFAEAIRDRISFLPWSNIKDRSVFDKRTQKTYQGVTLRSRTNPFLTEQHHRWYSDGKKIVPRDLKLTNECMLWWYVGDGSLYRKKTRPNYRRIVLSTDSFSAEDRDFLEGELSIRLGPGVYQERVEIVIARQALCSFIEAVGVASPVTEYCYKFDFGPYVDRGYFQKSFADRPLAAINEYRKKHRVREMNYKSKKEITHG